MKILVDADACPVKQIIERIARSRKVPVVMVVDTSHVLTSDYSEIIVVDQAKDSADICLANLVAQGDIVVSQDYGVAAMALGKGAAALNQNGLIYTDSNIDQLLFERHLGQKSRRTGKRTAAVKKRTSSDDEAFESALIHLLQKITQ